MESETRLRLIASRIIADLREAVVDLRITEDEIHAAATFFNRLGVADEASDLLDILFGVTSVIATRGTNGGTTPNLAGPYYLPGAPTRPGGRLYDGSLPEGETALVVRGTVTDAATGLPVSNAVLDVWQADSKGRYDEGGHFLRGLVPVDESGAYAIRTVLPEGYEIPARGPTTEFLTAIGLDNWRPAHIHLRVHLGDRTALQTQFFVAGQSHLDRDPVDAVRDDLIVAVRPAADGEGMEMRFDVKLDRSGGTIAPAPLAGPKVHAGSGG